MENLLKEFAQKLNTETFLDDDKYKHELVPLYYKILDVLSSDYESYRKYIASFLHILEQNDARALTYSLYAFYQLSNELIKLDIKELDTKSINRKITKETEQKYLDSIPNAFSKNNRPRISNFEEFDTSNLSKDEMLQIMSMIIDIIEEKSKQVEFSKDDTEVIAIQIAIFKKLAKQTDNQILFYFVIGQYIDRLNTSEYHQIARNTSEETILASFEDKLPQYGFFISYFCYAIQGSTQSSLLYANLSLYCFKTKAKFIYDSYVKQFLTTTIKYFRNIGNYNEAIKIYHLPRKVKLSNYDRHNLDHLYFTCLLPKANKKLPNELLDYLNKERELLLSGNSHDVTPWLIVLYNIKRIYPESFSNENGLNFYLKSFEFITPKDVQEKYKSILFGEVNKLKEIFKVTLLKLGHTSYVNDLHYDNEKALILASRLADESSLSNDAEGLLLSMLIKSDFTLLLKNKNVAEFAELRVPENDASSFYNIYPDILNSVIANSEELSTHTYTWLAASEEKLFQLNLVNKSFHFNNLTDWNKSQFRILEKEDYFHSLSFQTTLRDRHGVYQVSPEEYNDQTNKIKNDLTFAQLSFTKEPQNILIIKDMDISQFPHTLFLDKKNEFLSLKCPITNILSTEWYLKDITNEHNSKLISKSIWIPTEEGDITINRLYDSISQLLSEKEFNISQSSEPENPVTGNINIICSHGAKDIAKRQVLYPADNPVFDLDKYIGKGDVLIFFVCHSGSYKNDFLKNNISSIVKTYISKGYRSIIAPFWALQVDIPGIWLPEFIKQIENGKNIEECVYQANIAVFNKYPHPAAWGSMHLYGNPHINYKN